MPETCSVPSSQVARRVATFKSALLPLSETFILEQVASCSFWHNRLFGYSLVQGGLSIEVVDHDVLWHGQRPLLAKLLNRVSRQRFEPYLAAKRIRSFSPDLIHVHFGTEAQSNWNLISRFDLPIVVTLHGRDITVRPDEWESGNQGKRMANYPKGLRRLARDSRVHFVAVSQWIRQAAMDFGLPSEKIDVHPIGVDIRRFTPAPELRMSPPVILFVGRLVEKKGVEYLLHAMPSILQQSPQARIVVIGDGPLQDSARSLVRKLCIPVEFLGSQPSEIVLGWMRKSTVLCLPSVTAKDGDAEGLGIVLLEAQSCGIPVVTSARGGRDEGIEDGVTGFSVAERDIEGLADRIAQILGHEALRDRLSLAARDRMIRLFDIRSCTLSLENRYEKLVERHLKKCTASRL
jgi:glycosyltransferase involved in cell wall biosynthesis